MEEFQRRETWGERIKMQLKSGMSVQYRSPGWSLAPRVRFNDLFTYEPVTTTESIQEDDIVFGEVQTVKEKFKYPEGPDGKTRFTISNISGQESGWCYIEHLYGKLVEVLR